MRTICCADELPGVVVPIRDLTAYASVFFPVRAFIRLSARQEDVAVSLGRLGHRAPFVWIALCDLVGGESDAPDRRVLRPGKEAAGPGPRLSPLGLRQSARAPD